MLLIKWSAPSLITYRLPFRLYKSLLLGVCIGGLLFGFYENFSHISFSQLLAAVFCKAIEVFGEHFCFAPDNNTDLLGGNDRLAGIVMQCAVNVDFCHSNLMLTGYSIERLMGDVCGFPVVR